MLANTELLDTILQYVWRLFVDVVAPGMNYDATKDEFALKLMNQARESMFGNMRSADVELVQHAQATI